MPSMLEDFKNQRKFFGDPMSIREVGRKPPAEWWETYGDDHPELQKFSICVLSLTCNSFRCYHNWSAFEMVGRI